MQSLTPFVNLEAAALR